MYNYSNLTSPTNVQPGLSDTIYIAPLEWLDKVAEPEDNGYKLSSLVNTVGDHEFKEGCGFLECLCKPFTSSASNRNIKSQDLNVNLLGSYTALHGSISLLSDIPCLVLFNDLVCGLTYQYGTFDSPAFISADFSTSAARGGGDKGYSVIASFAWPNVLFYNGIINPIDDISALMVSEKGLFIVTEDGKKITTEY